VTTLNIDQGTGEATHNLQEPDSNTHSNDADNASNIQVSTNINVLVHSSPSHSKGIFPVLQSSVIIAFLLCSVTVN